MKKPSGRGARSAIKATDAELRPYGYAAGKTKRWCAACEREHKGLGPKAFKCRPCAELQFADVEALCHTRFGAKK
jgi:hypothetical protein